MRGTNESKDSLVARTLVNHGYVSGVYEYTSGNGSLILSFEIRSATEIDKNEPDFQETWTLFNALYSTDGINYQKQLIDTVGTSNSCWAPVSADTLLLLNVDRDLNNELCLLLTHVPFCDAYLTYSEAVFFDDFFSFPVTKTINALPELNFRLFAIPPPSKEQHISKIMEELKAKGVLKN